MGDNAGTSAGVTAGELAAVVVEAKIGEVEVEGVHLMDVVALVVADDLGNFDPHATRSCWFHGRSVTNLKSSLANHLNEDCVDNITTCVRAGFQGRLTPLVEPMFIVLLTTGSPGRCAQAAILAPGSQNRWPG
ncbi:hypothetical protein HU200_035679 [Digitaria exilis]|uniref:DUF569 domain-containing protein n=1 Tax=Digitaria exilis TaxID=1010633 RepID=A0A835BGE2_9POAL|nr:hypothetical protein HU200_035679 [Digitaria exilis]